MYLYHRINLNIYSSNMEQAVNSFSEGIQLDTHPMVQGNNSLTDCLNGTLITMNGNEAVLQNDMGNRRVDNAFLPAGYEPVGMKEYGGIIYVAAYNPVTNRSQIGSFPSPERKIDINNNQGISINFRTDLASNDNIYSDNQLNIDCIKTDSILYPLTGKNSLHVGDKFVVYGSLDQAGDITNYDNTSGNKVYSPKNKKYTLSLGILNSQNEFVDITKTLCRWEGSTLIEFNNNESDIYKFNSGYFIASSYSDSSSTISDNLLIRERQKKAINTYAYKLVGPLYLKVQLNHIEDFSYNIYGITTNPEKTTATIFIEGTIKYNCPDGITSGGNGNDIYSTFAIGTPTFNGFDLVGESLPNTQASEITYDEKTNLYTAKITKSYNIEAQQGNIYNYVIGVNAFQTGSTYLSGLSTKGSIDLSLLGSGTIKLKGWRFINNFNTREGIISYAFEAYPEYGKVFEDLSLTFTDIRENSKIFKIENQQLNNGRVNLNVSWDNVGLEPRKLYKVEFKYYERDISTGERSEKTINLGNNKICWYLTTELFNSCYNPSNEDFIENYFDPKEGNEQTTLNKKLTLDLQAWDIPNISVSPEYSNINGSIMSETQPLNNIFKITTDNTYKINIKASPKIDFVDENLYPDYVRFSGSKIPTSATIVFNNISSNTIKDGIQNIMSDSNIGSIKNEMNINDLNLGTIIIDNNNVYETNKTYSIRECYKTTAEYTDITVNNLFKSLNNCINKIGSSQSDVYYDIKTPYLGIIGLCYTDHGGSNPQIKLALWKNNNDVLYTYDESDWDTGENSGKNEWRTFSLSDNYSFFQEKFKQYHGDGELFIIGITPKEWKWNNHTDTGHHLSSFIWNSNMTGKEEDPYNSTQNILRVWAKGPQEQYGLLLTRVINSTSILLSDVRNYIINALELLEYKNLHFVYEFNKTAQLWYKSDNYSYNNKFNLNLSTKYTYNISNANFPAIEGINLVSDPITFVRPNQDISNEGYLNINLKSNDKFFDYVEEIVQDNINQVESYDETLKTFVDINGNKLSSGTIYKEVIINNKTYLKPCSSSNLQFNSGNEHNEILFPVTYGTPSGEAKNQVVWITSGNENHIRINMDFTNTPIINKFNG